MTTPRFADELTLAATGTAISNARRFVASTLARWRAVHILDDALQVVTELVTDAVRATGVLDTHLRWSEVTHLNLIAVRLLGLEESIRIEVWDCSPHQPVQLEVAGSPVKRGCYATAGGKVIWAELPVYPMRRRPSAQPTAPAERFGQVGMEAELLRRVREGL